jgi:predicted RNA-binding Zn ribbon-like protein
LNTNLDLCLAFANTMDWHASDIPEETLLSYADLVVWARDVGLASQSESDELLQAARGRPVEAGRALERARELREAIYRVFVAVIEGTPPSEGDVTILNHALASAMSGAYMERTEDGFTWGWGDRARGLDALMGPVARSAGALLTSEMRDRVGQCADDRGCGYLFLDTSKNRSRRWCSMEACGNRAKAARHYQRQQSQS